MKITGCTDPGQVRHNNEDWIAFDSDAGVAVLADGMGGLNAGEVASREAAERLLELLTAAVAAPDAAAMRLALARTNAHVFELGRRRTEFANMGTTVVAWTRHDDAHCCIGHVGDSRAYRFRDGALELLTRDHSLLEQMADRGTPPAASDRAAMRHIITRAIGLEAVVGADARLVPMRQGDVFLLCSDGLNDMLEDAAIAAALSEALPAGLEATSDALVAAANAAGGRDNVSVLLIEI